MIIASPRVVSEYISNFKEMFYLVHFQIKVNNIEQRAQVISHIDFFLILTHYIVMHSFVKMMKEKCNFFI